MAGKQRYLRSIDLPKVGAFDAGADAGGASGTLSPIPPATPTIGAPTNLTLSTAIERNAVTPTSLISATWYPPPGVNPASYVIQWSVSSVFATSNGAAAASESATISGLIPSTVYYVRVAAVVASVQGDWSATATITTAADTTAPSPVTGQAASFAGGGDLVITWTNPASANFRDVEITIYESASKVTTYATLFNATGRQVWTVAQNLAATSGAGDPTLYVELRARSWGGIFSTVVTTGLITKAAPSAPTVALDGFSQLMVCSVTSTPESPYSLFEYVWKRDGSTIVTDLLSDTSDTYAAGNSGDEGNHSWTCTVRQRDAFGQYSTATVSASIALDTLTIAYLRSGLIFTDSVGNSVTTLAVLKDAITASGGISYAA